MAIDTLDELKYYCNETAPVGALMLIGEWGCGKTYLIGHTLSEALKDSHIFIRISLFGVSSIDAISTAVKRAWIEVNFKNKGKGGELANKFLSFKSRFSSLFTAINAKAGAVLSLDIAEVVPISNHIDNNIVVLVFDDFERCRIDPVDLLGVINDYCENQKFHTIIIANEDYMLKQERCESVTSKNDKDSAKEKLENHPYVNTTTNHLSYKEIKEKIVPDYNSIIKSIIESFATSDEEYK